MVLRGRNSKDILSDRNSNIGCSLILENFAGINFRESPTLKFGGNHFSQIDIFGGQRKQFNFANLVKIREISFMLLISNHY